jgi:hypothetical protein
MRPALPLRLRAQSGLATSDRRKNSTHVSVPLAGPSIGIAVGGELRVLGSMSTQP